MTPFPTGLSLFIHLGIIFVAWVLERFGITRARKKEVIKQGPLTPQLFAQTVSVQVVSMLILVLMGTLMGSFFLTALTTGIREGQNEPHRVFIKKTAGDVSAVVADIPAAFSIETQYEKDISAAPQE